jgi:hypothetical protein
MSSHNASGNFFGGYIKDKIKALPEKMTSEQIAALIREYSIRDGTPVPPVTAALVRRWLNGTRVPGFGHDAIPLLAEILNVDIKELEREQHKSLKQQLIRRDEERRVRQQEQGIRSLDSFSRPNIDQNPRRIASRKSSIEGTQHLIERTISVLNDLPDLRMLSEKELPKEEDCTILLSSQGRSSALQAPGVSDDLESEWYGAIKNVLEKGWHVCHLIRVDEIEGSSQRLIKVITDMLAFVGQKGNYLPHAFTQTFPVAYSPMIVPSWNGAKHTPKAMLSLAGNNVDYVDSSIYIKHPAQVKILRAHAEQLKSITEPIFSVFEQPRQINLLEALQGICDKSSDQIVILNRLTDIVKPLSWFTPTSRWAKHMKKNLKLSPEKLSELIVAKKSRVENLRDHLKNGTYACKYIFMNRCVQNFSRGSRMLDFTDANFQPNSQERLEQLETMLELLELPNYEVAFLEEEMFLADEQFDPPGFQDYLTKLDIQPHLCSVNNKYLVLMEVLPPLDLEDGENCWISINNKVIVDAFYEKLSIFWGAIPAQRKDKAYIRRWLNQEIGN